MLTLEQLLIEQLHHLSESQQQMLLDYARTLSTDSLPPGTPGDDLIAQMGTFNFAPGELDRIAQVIEEDCEKVDWGEW